MYDDVIEVRMLNEQFEEYSDHILSIKQETEDCLEALSLVWTYLETDDDFQQWLRQSEDKERLPPNTVQTLRALHRLQELLKVESEKVYGTFQYHLSANPYHILGRLQYTTANRDKAQYKSLLNLQQKQHYTDLSDTPIYSMDIDITPDYICVLRELASIFVCSIAGQIAIYHILSATKLFCRRKFQLQNATNISSLTVTHLYIIIFEKDGDSLSFYSHFGDLLREYDVKPRGKRRLRELSGAAEMLSGA
ncbi:unnamed protein product [Didymodactylos carnosus]|uniref:Uncharacterized protein n=1 Tax=Didymodactylos carnosus TaxID=1234261 RepID=A0A815GNF5_9BILA|nr:unnamed protein product [Didymodactylos carnosus]CAF1342346.1 unnamed protein product [Didymodactylos carnosus]CAF3957318.1 unnamed protein product [Didymodactylos carnosus]CAF4204411.1 unnamed protein product [Didymodactylos carnosus]